MTDFLYTIGAKILTGISGIVLLFSGAHGVSNLQLPSPPVESSATVTQTAPTPSHYEINVVNDYFANPVTLVAGTRFESEDGRIFHSENAFTIPGKEGAQDSSVVIDVVAEQAGSAPIGRLTLPGLATTRNMYAHIYALAPAGQVVDAVAAGGASSAETGGIAAAPANSSFVTKSDLSALLTQFGTTVKLLPQTIVTREFLTRQTDRTHDSISNSLDNYLSLDGGTMTNTLTVAGVSGLTDADIPDGITASNYLSLSGGTLTGLASFTNASTTLFSALGPAYFGATATSTFGTDGSLTLASALGVASGGTGTTTWQTGSIPFFNGTRLTEDTSNLFWDSTNNRLGIGSTTPWAQLSVNPDGISGPSFAIGSSTATHLVVTNGGDVGIGTTTPPALLSINDPAGTDSFLIGSNTPKFIVKDSGRVGIGTASPGYALTLGSGQLALPNGSATTPSIIGSISNAGIYFSGGNNLSFAVGNIERHRLGSGGLYANTGGLAIGATAGVPDVWLMRDSANNLRISSNGSTGSANLLVNGSVGIATTSPWRKLSVTGTVGFDGLTGSTGAGSLCLSSTNEVVYNSGSDACLSSTRATKHDIEALTLSGLETVNLLEPISFVYNEGDGRVRYGFIADDTAEIEASLVTYSVKGEVSGIDDRAILSIAVKAIRELYAMVTGFAESFTTKIFKADSVTTERLCVGSTCVTEDQFKAMVQQAGQQPASQSQPNTQESSPTTETEIASTTSATSESEEQETPASATESQPDATASSTESAEESSTISQTPTPADEQPDTAPGNESADSTNSPQASESTPTDSQTTDTPPPTTDY